MRQVISIMLLCIIATASVFLWFYSQEVVVVREAAPIGEENIIDDAVVARMLTLKSSDEWVDIEADLVTSYFSDFAGDISALEDVFYEKAND